MSSVNPVHGNTGNTGHQVTNLSTPPWKYKPDNELVSALGNPELNALDRQAAGQEFENRVKGPTPLSREDQAIVDKAKKEPLTDKEQDRADAMLYESKERKLKDMTSK